MRAEKITVFEEILKYQMSEINFSFKGIVSDLLKKLSKMSSDSILKHNLFHHNNLGI